VRYGVHLHRGNETCIVDLDARYATFHDESTPVQIDSRRVGNQRKESLDHAKPMVSIFQWLSQAIPFARTREHIPELDSVLYGRLERVSVGPQMPDCGTQSRVKWVNPIGKSKEDVCVHQVNHG
jgi:hypothetical protein